MYFLTYFVPDNLTSKLISNVFKKTGKNFMERFYKMVNMRFSVYLINILKILFLKYFNIIVHNGLYFLFTLLQENITVCGKQGGKLEVNATKSS